jgi:hypothetical protein
MKKAASILMFLVLFLSFSFGSVLADGIMTLKETRNDPGGDVIFVLEFSGDFPESYFKGFVTVGDEKYPIHCNVVDEGVVQCTVSRKVAGKNVTLQVGDFYFWTFVPEGGVRSGSTQYCYNVYDVYDIFDENEDYVGTFWEPFDVHCQDTPAGYGDLIDVYNSYYDDVFEYEFMPGSPPYICSDNVIIEDAYYYNVSCSF